MQCERIHNVRCVLSIEMETLRWQTTLLKRTISVICDEGFDSIADITLLIAQMNSLMAYQPNNITPDVIVLS